MGSGQWDEDKDKKKRAKDLCQLSFKESPQKVSHDTFTSISLTKT